ncbi:DUF2061 domain-containing protein [Parvularcula sp. LCG005]|uniref:DUF2061 domain-containing protein n=1 Tax=Parvularcula sp. LCG005 TaxID=3078805 RepID=UPI0029436572|nr:DUF2061 domain-containing protein [Parvularcula sp. LCG005]WOI54504.1 DUF2061 domain-containing protein [Parvularcula sp. LCG005]
MSRRFKPLTYSLMHLTVAIAVAYALTRSWQAALAIGLVEPLVQTIAYTFHERAWDRASKRDTRSTKADSLTYQSYQPARPAA